MNQINKGEFARLIKTACDSSQRNIDSNLVETYFNELLHIPEDTLKTAFKWFIVNSKFPSINEVQEFCKSKLNYNPNIIATPPPPLEDGQVEMEHDNGIRLCTSFVEDYQKYDDIVYRLEAVYPQCTNLTQSIQMWKTRINNIKSAKWHIHVFIEYDGMAKIRKCQAGKQVDSLEKIYYANVGCRKYPINRESKIIRCDFNQTKIAYCAQYI